MLDELLDNLFDRDGRRNDDPNQPRRKGFRGLLDRLRSAGDDDGERRYQDGRQRRADSDDDREYAGRGRRDRDRDFMDLD
jgi:hypothetical protein